MHKKVENVRGGMSDDNCITNTELAHELSEVAMDNCAAACDSSDSLQNSDLRRFF